MPAAVEFSMKLFVGLRLLQRPKLGIESLNTPRDHLRRTGNQPFAMPVLQDVARQILETVSYIHRQSIIHTDLKPETQNLICARTIGLMKPGALIVNCARGEVVNSADVAAALKSGALRGYASDVLDFEPPAADHPLTNLPNSIITPHIASRTNESVVRQASTAVQNLIAGFRGEKPEGVKNPEVPFKKHF